MIRSVPVSTSAMPQIADPIQARRSALLDALMRESLAPQSVQSPLEGAAKLGAATLNSYFAGQQERKIEDRQKALAAVLGQAAQVGQTGVKEFRNPDNPDEVLIPGQKPGMDAYIAALSQSGNIDAAPIASGLVTKQLEARDAARLQMAQALAPQGFSLNPEGTGVVPLSGYAEGKAGVAGATAGAEANARNQSDLQFKPRIAADTAAAEAPIKIDTAARTAAATAPIDVEKQRQIDQNKSNIEMPQRTQKTEDTLRNDFNALPEVKNYREARVAYNAIVDASKRDSLASDLNIVYGFAKLMDPGSVVREGEQVMVTKTGGIFDQIQGWLNSINGGAKLPPDVRAALVKEAEGRFAQHQQAFDTKVGEVSGIARRYNVDPQNIILEKPQGAATSSAPSIQPGQKVGAADLGKLQEGTELTGSDGRDYIVRNGQAVLK